MQAALNRLAEFIGDPSIATRDPNSPLSFSSLKYEVSKSQSDTLLLYQKDQAKAFSPLRPDGRPIRRYVTFGRLLSRSHFPNPQDSRTENSGTGSMENVTEYRMPVGTSVSTCDYINSLTIARVTAGYSTHQTTQA
jgi:hypothetical protein